MTRLPGLLHLALAGIVGVAFGCNQPGGSVGGKGGTTTAAGGKGSGVSSALGGAAGKGGISGGAGSQGGGAGFGGAMPSDGSGGASWSGGASGSGGASSSRDTSASGGTRASGGSSGSGGASSSGSLDGSVDANLSGGASGTGGMSSSGGRGGSDGVTSSGGTSVPGGASGAGGMVGAGGTGVSGGSVGSGGAIGSSGVTGSGGSSNTGGATASGGVISAGGAASGGSPGTGGTGTGGAPGSCAGSCAAPTPTSCSAPQVRISQVDLGSTLNYSTSETDNIPLAIAAKPGGGSLIAWMTGYSPSGSSTDSQVHIAQLDCDDKLVGTPFTLEGHDFQDIAADANGGIVMLTRDGPGSGDQHCGDVNNLCVLPGSAIGCYGMYMARFNCAGQEQWAAKLDTATAASPGYSSGSGWNFFVWWYQHHGRLAFDGNNYAAYFCDAITVSNNSCSAGTGKVDIHEGDRMQVVDPMGAILTGHDSFDLGCSHSWTTRIVWDPRTNHFVTVCATDNDCRVARSPNYQTIASATCDGTLFGGDVVNATTTGYWMTWSYQNIIKLEHFSTGASDKTVTTAGTTQHPHLVSYGPANMLLTWQSGSSMAAQIYDTGTGAAVGSQFTISSPDHPWQSWKPFPDGSVAWAAASSASSSIQIARVMPCSN